MNGKARTRGLGLLTVLDTWIPAGFIAIVTVLIVAETAGRWAGARAIIWSVEVAAVLFTWAVFLAGAAAIRSGRAITVEALVTSLPPRIQMVCDVFATLVTLIVALGWAWLLVLLTQEQGGLETPVLGIPFWVRTAGAALAFALIAAYELHRLLGRRVAEVSRRSALEEVEE